MKYITLHELRAKLGNRSRAAIYLDLEAGRLPQPVKLGGRLLWPEHEIDEALAALRAPAVKAETRSFAPVETARCYAPIIDGPAAADIPAHIFEPTNFQCVANGKAALSFSILESEPRPALRQGWEDVWPIRKELAFEARAGNHLCEGFVRPDGDADWVSALCRNGVTKSQVRELVNHLVSRMGL